MVERPSRAAERLNDKDGLFVSRIHPKLIALLHTARLPATPYLVLLLKIYE